MNIVVCLKQVPKKDSILRIGPDQKWIDERDLSYEMSEADAYALEEALRQKEKHGGSVFTQLLGHWLAVRVVDRLMPSNMTLFKPKL